MPACTTGVLLLSGESGFVNVARVPIWQRALLNGLKAGITNWLVLIWGQQSKLQASFDTDPRLQTLSHHIIDMPHANIDQLRKLLPTGNTPDQDVIIMPGHAVFTHPLLHALQTATAPTLAIVNTTEDTPQTQPPSVALLRMSGLDFSQLLETSWHEIAAVPDPIQVIATALQTVPQVTTINIISHLWVPLTKPVTAQVADAESQLLSRLGRDGDSPLVRLIARRVSRTITRWLLPTWVQPNHITLFSGAIGLCGAVLLTQPTMTSQLLGTLLFLLSTIIDGCDGELARLTFQESTFGAKLDVTMDNIVHGMLFPAIAVGQYRQHQDALYLILGAFALGGVVVSMLVFLPYLLRPEKIRTSETRLHESLASRDFAYLLPILAIFHKLHWFLWATAIGAYVFAAGWLIIAWRQRRP